MVLFDGTAPDKTFQRLCGFVFQDDLLMAQLTVRETVEFAAKLRLPQELGDAVRAQRVQAMLKQLALVSCAETLIGSEKSRGVSGGERKRAAVAVELVARPPLLFLDEPTSGLDAATALHLCRTLRGFAHAGMMIVSSIHQPRSNIFSLFSSLLLLAKGRAAYFGSTALAVEYMRTEAGLELPPRTNPADWLLDVVDAQVDAQVDAESPVGAGAPAAGAGGTAGAERSLTELWHSNGHRAAAGVFDCARGAPLTISILGATDTKASGKVGCQAGGQAVVHAGGQAGVEPGDTRVAAIAFELGPRRRWQTSTWWQFQVLLARSTKQQRGDVFNTINVFQILAVAIIVACLWSGATSVRDVIGVLFFVNIQQSFNAQNTVLRLFPTERALMQRERGCGTYRMLPYFLAKSAGDLVAVFVLPVGYAVIIYFSVGLRRELGSFLWYLLLSLTTVFTGQSLGLLVSIAVPDLALANCVSFVLVLFIMLFGGFYVNVDRIPEWISGVRYASYMYWAFSGMVINEFGGRQLPCGDSEHAADYGGCPFSGDLVVQEMGYSGGSVGRSFGCLLGMAILFRFCAYLSLRFGLQLRV